LDGDLLAMIDASTFLHFPFEDVLLPQYWLAAILRAPDLGTEVESPKGVKYRARHWRPDTIAEIILSNT
jgi:hypothetical protein